MCEVVAAIVKNIYVYEINMTANPSQAATAVRYYMMGQMQLSLHRSNLGVHVGV